MRAELIGDDDEPLPGGIDILRGIPHGHSLDNRQARKYLDVVRLEVGAIACLEATDQFVVTEGSSDTWRHEKVRQHEIIGRLAACGLYDVVYSLDEYHQPIQVPGVIVRTAGSGSVMVPGEDTRSIVVVRH